LCVADRKNNFPPLPSWCPVQPCFYQDLSVEIPLEFQRIVRMAYYFWIGEHQLDTSYSDINMAVIVKDSE